MKKIFRNILLAFLIILTVRCDKGLEEININRANPTAVDPAALLNNAIVNLSYSTRSVIFDMGIVQQLVTPNGGVLAGANFNQDSRDAGTGGAIWTLYYQNVIKYTHDVIVQTKSVPGRSNLYNMARIIQAYAFMILTDEYGSIPFTDAGAGYTDLILFQNTRTSRIFIQSFYRSLQKPVQLYPPMQQQDQKPRISYMRETLLSGKNLDTRCYCVQV